MKTKHELELAEVKAVAAAAEAEALRIHAKARYAVRLRGQHSGQQAGGQRGGEIDDARSGHLLMNAAHKGQHVQGCISPVAADVSQQTGPGQGPGRIHVAQKRHGRNKVFKADEAHAQASLVQMVTPTGVAAPAEACLLPQGDAANPQQVLVAGIDEADLRLCQQVHSRMLANLEQL